MPNAYKRPDDTWQGTARCDGTCPTALKHGKCRGHRAGLSGFTTKKDALAAAHKLEAQLKLAGTVAANPDQ